MQISPSRPPQAPPPPRPDASVVRATAATITAALTTATVGDSVELSAAALAASDRLTGQTLETPNRPGVGHTSADTPIPLGATIQGGARRYEVAADAPRSAAPRPEDLPYAPNPLAAPARPQVPAVWASLPRLGITSLVVGTFALAILLGAVVG